MNIIHKSSGTQLFRLMLYSRALHPELFDLQDRRFYRQPEYEVESWITSAGHVIRFQVKSHCLTETVLENGDHLPESGLLHALPCLGEKDYELGPQNNSGINYVTTVQTESLNENLYLTTLREMNDFAAESKALAHDWNDSRGNPCLSIVDAQKFKREYHVQSYHLLGSTGLILRTQSIFEVL